MFIKTEPIDRSTRDCKPEKRKVHFIVSIITVIVEMAAGSNASNGGTSIQNIRGIVIKQISAMQGGIRWKMSILKYLMITEM